MTLLSTLLRPRHRLTRYTCAACWGCGTVWIVRYRHGRIDHERTEYTLCRQCNGTGYIEYREDA